MPSWSCESSDFVHGGCIRGESNGSGVEVTATTTDPGATKDGTASSVDPGPAKKPVEPTATETHIDVTNPPGPTIQCDDITCQPVVTETDTDPGTDPTVTAPVTIADIADFVPETGATGMEPNGWTPIGLDANFYSDAAPHVVSGRLLDEDAEVRFTPLAWHWDYGDGSTKKTGVGGASWMALGVDEFAATATSHHYDRAGDFDVQVGIEYAAEYRYDGDDWTAIAGTVTVAGNPLHARAGTASTVLVSSDCVANPSAPGC